jgi:hypothetical protein
VLVGCEGAWAAVLRDPRLAWANGSHTSYLCRAWRRSGPLLAPRLRAGSPGILDDSSWKRRRERDAGSLGRAFEVVPVAAGHRLSHLERRTPLLPRPGDLPDGGSADGLFRVNPLFHHLQGEPDVADRAVILGMVLRAGHPIGNRPGRGETAKLLLTWPKGNQMVVA